MAQETILQHWIVSKFILPFLLIFFIVFAILEKTKIFGDGKKQLNAMMSFVIALVFVSVAYPKEIVGNMILFLTVALVVAFVALLLWGFVSGGDAKIVNDKIKWVAGVVIVIAVIVALLWAAGVQGSVFNFLFGQSWSKSFWTNASFIIVIAAALALVLITSKSK